LPTDDLNVSSGWSSSASLILSQPLATFGRLRANEQQAAAAIKFQEHTLERAEQELLYSVIVAYTLLIRDRNGLQIARDNLELLSRELSDTRARFEVRETTRADLQQVETRVRLAEAQVAVATSSLAESEARFHEIVGAPAGDILPPNPLQLPVDGLAEARDHALENIPVLKAAHARERISRAETSSAVSARLPRVDLRGRVDLLPVTPYSNDLRQRGLVGEVVVSGPLFTGGELAARVNEARANNDADWRLIDAASRGLVAEVSSAWRNLEAQTNAVESLSFAVEAAEAAYEGSLTQQRAGTRTTLDVLILARELLTARTSLNVTSTDAYLARARILLALGDIDRSYLLPNAETYNPAAHQEDVAWYPPIVIFGPIFRTLSAIGRPEFEDRPSRDGDDCRDC